MIPLADGRLLTAKEIYDNFATKGMKVKQEDKTVVKLDKGPKIFTFDKGKIKNKRVSAAWKLKNSKELVKVTLASGDTIKVTEEHPFLVVTKNLNLKYIKASELRKDMFVVVPKKLNIKFSSLSKIKESILKSISDSGNFVVFLENEESKVFFERLKKRNVSKLFKKGIITTYPYECVASKRFRSSDYLSLSKELGFSLNEAYDMVSSLKNSSEKWRAGHTSNRMCLPKNEEDFKKLGYVLGCMAGDGHINEGILNNNDADIQEEYMNCVSSSLNLKTKVIQGHTCQLVRTNGGLTFERFLIDILGFPEKEKSGKIEIPLLVQRNSSMLIGFIRGWFDTDGYVSPINYSIEITSKSEKIVKQASTLLLNFGICSSKYCKNNYYNLRISNNPYVSLFLNIFNPALRRKRNMIAKVSKKTSTSRIFGLTPLKGKVLGEMSVKISDKKIPFFTKYKSYKNLSRLFLSNLTNTINSKDKILEKIRNFLNLEILCVKVRNIEKIIPDSEFVYDFTVNKTKNFVAERMIIHNTTLLDYIRGSSVVKTEAGGITQHIGATEVPISSIKKICGKLIEKWKIDVKISGLLIIDTPGHEAFTLLRKRGGSLADIAVLIIDITEGIKPQTEESINILRQNNTPFIVAANKIDKISGWAKHGNECFLDSFSKQNKNVQEEVDKKIYELIGQLFNLKFEAERYDRVKDFKKQVSIVPVSALTGEGVPDLLTTLTGVTQKYLEKRLEIDVKGKGKGTILEVKEVKGLGKTIDVILYDGIMRKGDYLVIGNPGNVIETKIKALLKISPLKEIRVEKQFIPVNEIGAAAGIKISALNLENVMAGVPIISLRSKEEISKAKKEVIKEIESIEMKTEKEGVIIRADTLGSLEAIIKTFNEMNVPIRKARIGSVNKKDVSELEEIDGKYKIIFAFNTHVLPEAEELSKKRKIKIIKDNVIYRLSEEYENYLKILEEEKKRAVLEKVTLPAKIKIMRKFIFRKSKPAIVGVEVKGGVIREGVKLMKENGEGIGEVKAVHDKGVNIREASIGMEVAVSIDKAVIGRNVDDNDTLLTFLTKDDYKILKENENILSDNEKNVLEEIKEIMKKKDKHWDVV